MMIKETSLLTLLKEVEVAAFPDYRRIVSTLDGTAVAFGFFCPYVPEELIHAAGALPLRLMGFPTRMVHAPAHLPTGCCHLAKSSLESLLRGELDFLKGVIFSHTCDAMQGLSDIWAFQKRPLAHFNLMVPSNMDSKFARPYFKEELERLKDFLESHLGKISSQNLEASIKLFNRIREGLSRLYGRRRDCPNCLPGDHFARIIRAGYLMDRVRYLDLLNELLDAMPGREEGQRGLIPVYLTGNMVHPDSFFSLVEDAGGLVVSDDLCSGARFFRLETRENGDPVDSLTDRYLSPSLCPTKHRGAHARIETLLKEVGESGAKGVIFLFYKSCEAHFFDYPDLKAALDSKKIPSLLLEVDDPATSQGQLKIRIQAFIEMLTE